MGDRDTLLAEAGALVDEAWRDYERAASVRSARFAWEVLLVAVAVYDDLRRGR